MTLHFPSLDALCLAITSGLIPAAMLRAPVVVRRGESGALDLEPEQPPDKVTLAALAELGIKPSPDRLESGQRSEHWLQAVPVTPETPASFGGAVLFRLRPASLLAEVVGEMVRLGNDRQSFRVIANSEGQADFALLRVVAPPYYTLLRALEADRSQGSVTAFVERRPGVWLQVGHGHRLLQLLKPTPGTLLLVDADNAWQTLPEGPFRDIYDQLELTLPEAKATGAAAPEPPRFRIPLTLGPASRLEPAELWIIADDAVEQINNLVQSAPGDLIRRLAFAVVESEGQTLVLLRARPGKEGPPVLPDLGQGYRTWLKLPNLFVPCASRLQPPLQREALRRLLADNPEELCWLEPREAGQFVPRTVADSAFRPLADWVDYVLHHEREPLLAWVEAVTFDFVGFECVDDLVEPSAGKARKYQTPIAAKPEAVELPTPPPPVLAVVKGQRPPGAEAAPAAEPPTAVPPSELAARLRDLESRFLALETPLDDPDRVALWRTMAQTNAALGHGTDAALCWLAVLWSGDAAQPGDAQAWLARESTAGFAEDRIAAICRAAEPTVEEVRGVAAWLTARHPAPATPDQATLNAARQFLERHEDQLPVRAVWLAGLAACRIGGGDLLGLTRTRDRLLQRLYEKGLSPDQDLPGFLRFTGATSGDRLRHFRDWLLRLPTLVATWVGIRQFASAEADPRDTQAYADLMLAFGLGRLGEETTARQLLSRAKAWLSERGGAEADVHQVLLEAFDFRVQQALAGKALAGSLPANLVEYTAAMAQEVRFKVDRLRMTSRILEPHHEIDAFRSYRAREYDAFQRALLALQDIVDRPALERECRRVLAEAYTGAGGSARRFRAVDACLRAAPRLSAELAGEILDRALEACDAHDALMEQATFLERALMVAAHFNRVELVPDLLERFRQVIHSRRGAITHDQLESLAAKGFRGLRKLGMQEESRQLLTMLIEKVVGRGQPGRLRPDAAGDACILAHVAGGLFHCGDNEQARAWLAQVRTVLLEGKVDRLDQTKLACAYVSALGQAPTDFALQALDELLANLQRVYDGYLTNSHYSLAKLRVVEAIVMAVVTEEFAMGQLGRRWLEDDEYLVRQRIHRDLAAAMAGH